MLPSIPRVPFVLLSRCTSSRLIQAPSSGIHTTAVLGRRTAGRHKPTINRDKPLTYEQSQEPYYIGVTKSWNSFSTSGLLDGLRTAETSHEDIFIRKFLHGTWPRLLVSDVIIKRRANQIFCSFIAVRDLKPSQFYFLIGYSEEIMSYVLKSTVRLEVQTCDNAEDLVYEYK